MWLLKDKAILCIIGGKAMVEADESKAHPNLTD
jgi:hypothetical protein